MWIKKRNLEEEEEEEGVVEEEEKGGEESKLFTSFIFKDLKSAKGFICNIPQMKPKKQKESATIV